MIIQCITVLILASYLVLLYLGRMDSQRILVVSWVHRTFLVQPAGPRFTNKANL